MPPSAKPIVGPVHTRKARPPPKPYNHAQPTQLSTHDTAKTSAISSKAHKRNTLTLHDWLTVVAYHDSFEKGKITQKEVVEHFQNQKEGALIFDQTTLS